MRRGASYYLTLLIAPITLVALCARGVLEIQADTVLAPVDASLDTLAAYAPSDGCVDDGVVMVLGNASSALDALEVASIPLRDDASRCPVRVLVPQPTANAREALLRRASHTTSSFALWDPERTVRAQVYGIVGRSVLLVSCAALVNSALLYAWTRDITVPLLALCIPLFAISFAAVAIGAIVRLEVILLAGVFVAFGVCVDDLCVLTAGPCRHVSARSVFTTTATSSAAVLTNIVCPVAEMRQLAVFLAIVFTLTCAASLLGVSDTAAHAPSTRFFTCARPTPFLFSQRLSQCGAPSRRTCAAIVLGAGLLAVPVRAPQLRVDGPSFRFTVFAASSNVMRVAACRRDIAPVFVWWGPTRSAYPTDSVEVVEDALRDMGASVERGGAALCTCDDALCALRASPGVLEVNASHRVYLVSAYLAVDPRTPLSQLQRMHDRIDALTQRVGASHASPAWGEVESQLRVTAVAGQSVLAGCLAVLVAMCVRFGPRVGVLITCLSAANVLVTVCSQSIVFGPQIGFADVLLTTLVVGVCSDYAIHVAEDGRLLDAVVMSALTTLVAAISLCAVPMQTFQKTGVYLSASTIFSFASALLVVRSDDVEVDSKRSHRVQTRIPYFDEQGHTEHASTDDILTPCSALS
jgi:hypothetical protein